MTFKQIWTSIKTVWQSRPFAVILPLVALGIYWWTHGHTWTAASFPTMSEWTAGTALLFTKFGHVMELFVGPPAPETLPPPVVAPLLKPSGDVPKVGGLVLLLGLGLVGTSCAHVDAFVKDVHACVNADQDPVVVALEENAGPAIEQAFLCEAGTAFDPSAIPACVEQGLAREVAGLGPDGERFKECVVTALENDATANPLARQRAHAIKARIVAARGGQ